MLCTLPILEIWAVSTTTVLLEGAVCTVQAAACSHSLGVGFHVEPSFALVGSAVLGFVRTYAATARCLFPLLADTVDDDVIRFMNQL